MPDANRELLKAIRRDPDFVDCFGGGEPTWLQGRKNPRPNQTAAQAKVATNRLVRTLRRYGRNNPNAMQLASRLDEKSRAATGASPVFMRAMQRWLVLRTDEFTSDIGGRWSVVSAVYKSCWAAPGSLGGDLFEELRRRVREALRAAGVRSAFAFFDVSADEHKDGLFHTHYRPHAWILFGQKRSRAVRKSSASTFRPARSCDDLWSLSDLTAILQASLTAASATSPAESSIRTEHAQTETRDEQFATDHCGVIKSSRSQSPCIKQVRLRASTCTACGRNVRRAAVLISNAEQSLTSERRTPPPRPA